MEDTMKFFKSIVETDESPKAKLQCKICPNAVFDTLVLFREHNKKYHKKDDKYACHKCDWTTKYISHLTRHYERNHSQPLPSTGLTGEASTRATYECKICDVCYEDNYSLRKHKKETHMTYTCDKCKYKNKDFTSFTQHMKEDHPQPSTSTGATGGATTRAKYQCEICNNGFEKQTSLSSHIEKAHMKYVCDQCEHTNTRFDKLTNHIKSTHAQLLTHTDETDKASLKAKYLCKICYDIFENRHSLSSHIKKHHKNYVCHKCTCRCKTFTMLTKHVKTCEHPQPSTSTCIIDEASTRTEFQCKVCYCICENEESLKVHKNDHILYACDKCNYENKYLTNVKRHVQDKHVQPSIIADITVDEASRRTEFQCKICDASFENKVTLSLHKEEHHIIYACANCPYMDKALHNVTRHVKLEHPQPSTSTGVTGEASTKAKYQCEICYKVYGQKNLLNLHIRQKHKYYACNKCTYIVISTEFDTLINHVKLEHPQPSTSTSEASTRTELQCKICSETCETTISLRLHYNTCHKKNNEFVCTNCEYTSKDISHIVRHMESYHSPTSIYCVVCDTYFYTKYEYITHQERHKDLSELDKFNCPKCNKKYKYFSALEAHYNRIHFSRS